MVVCIPVQFLRIRMCSLYCILSFFFQDGTPQSRNEDDKAKLLAKLAQKEEMKKKQEQEEAAKASELKPKKKPSRGPSSSLDDIFAEGLAGGKTKKKGR